LDAVMEISYLMDLGFGDGGGFGIAFGI
jgi:hypothetical protein